MCIGKQLAHYCKCVVGADQACAAALVVVPSAQQRHHRECLHTGAGQPALICANASDTQQREHAQQHRAHRGSRWVIASCAGPAVALVCRAVEWGKGHARKLTEMAASWGAPSALQISAVSHRFSTATSGLWVYSKPAVNSHTCSLFLVLRKSLRNSLLCKTLAAHGSQTCSFPAWQHRTHHQLERVEDVGGAEQQRVPVGCADRVDVPRCIEGRRGCLGFTGRRHGWQALQSAHLTFASFFKGAMYALMPCDLHVPSTLASRLHTCKC